MAESAPEITLVQYGGATRGMTMSHPCGKVHMALVFKGLAYKTKHCTMPNQVKRYNARGRVPILILNGERIVDSTDILTELDRRFPNPPLMPADLRARAMVKILEDWADEVLYFYGVYTRWCVPENFARLSSSILSKAPLPLRWIVPAIANRKARERVDGQGVGLKDPATVRREALECLDALDALLVPGSFAVGDAFTRADLSLASMVDQFSLAAINPDLATEVQKRGNIVAWLARVRAVVPSFAG